MVCQHRWERAGSKEFSMKNYSGLCELCVCAIRLAGLVLAHGTMIESARDFCDTLRAPVHFPPRRS